MEVLDKLFRLDGLEIELCGSWLWISGDTKRHKEALGREGAGCRWSSTKKMWYWHHEEEGRRWHKRDYSMQEIRSKYGSSRIQREENRQMRIGGMV